MARLVWADTALYDLDAIADYIALDKPDAAKLFLKCVRILMIYQLSGIAICRYHQ